MFINETEQAYSCLWARNQEYWCLCTKIKHIHAYVPKSNIFMLMSQKSNTLMFMKKFKLNSWLWARTGIFLLLMHHLRIIILTTATAFSTLILLLIIVESNNRSTMISHVRAIDRLNGMHTLLAQDISDTLQTMRSKWIPILQILLAWALTFYCFGKALDAKGGVLNIFLVFVFLIAFYVYSERVHFRTFCCSLF